MKTSEMLKESSEARSDRLEARVSSDLKLLFQRAADLQGITLSDFLISSLRQAALQTVQEHEVLRLSEEDARRFAEALLHPPPMSARLKAAARRYRKSRANA